PTILPRHELRPAQKGLTFMKLSAASTLAMVSLLGLVTLQPAMAAKQDPKTQKVISRGLDWLASQQSRAGHWTANEGRYPTSMTALAGMAFLAEGSTTTQGKY